MWIGKMILKENYYFKTVKYYTYKRYLGPKRWRSNYLFDRAVRGLRPGDIAVDCGAHVGHYTSMLASTGATVHAFEPNPGNFAKLKENTSNFPNVSLYNAAVDVSAGHAKLYYSSKPVKSGRALDEQGRNSEGSTLVREKEFIGDDDYVIVEKVDFISFIQNLESHISLVKMDIEGAELGILEKMTKSDSLGKIGKMFVETHEKQIPSKRDEFFSIRREIQSRYSNVYLDWH